MHTLSSGATRPAEQPGQAGHAGHFVNRLRCPGPFMTPSVVMPDDLAGGRGHECVYDVTKDSPKKAPCWRERVVTAKGGSPKLPLRSAVLAAAKPRTRSLCDSAALVR